VRAFCGQGDSSDADFRTFLCKTLWIFQNLQGQEGRGLSHCGHFADKGGGRSIFCDFLRTSFMVGT